jgi:tetratricopeptide (TPR) repeat protein
MLLSPGKRLDMNPGDDFPVLTRSRRVSPKVLETLQRIDTFLARRTKAMQAVLSKVTETELASLPQLAEEVCGPDHPELAKVLHKLAIFYHSTYDLEKAETLYRNSLSCAEKAFPEPTLEFGLILNNLGRLLHEQKKFPEAQELYERSLRVLRQAVGPDHPKLGTPMSNLSELYRESGNLTLSRGLLEDLIPILEKAHGPDHRRVVKAKQQLSLLMQLESWASSRG